MIHKNWKMFAGAPAWAGRDWNPPAPHLLEGKPPFPADERQQLRVQSSLKAWLCCRITFSKGSFQHSSLSQFLICACPLPLMPACCQLPCSYCDATPSPHVELMSKCPKQLSTAEKRHHGWNNLLSAQNCRSQRLLSQDNDSGVTSGLFVTLSCCWKHGALPQGLLNLAVVFRFCM